MWVPHGVLNANSRGGFVWINTWLEEACVKRKDQHRADGPNAQSLCCTFYAYAGCHCLWSTVKVQGCFTLLDFEWHNQCDSLTDCHLCS